MLRQATRFLPIRANRAGPYEFIDSAVHWIAHSAIGEGRPMLLCRHTPAARCDDLPARLRAVGA